MFRCLLVLLPLLPVACAQGAEYAQVQSLRERFQLGCEKTLIDDPSIAPSSVVGSELFNGRLGPPGLPFQLLVAFEEALSERDLPNSMARHEYYREFYPNLSAARAEIEIGRARKRNYDCARLGVNAVLEKIKANLTVEVWRAVEWSLYQNYNDNFVFAAAEIAAKLDLRHYEQFEVEILKAQPGKNGYLMQRANGG